MFQTYQVTMEVIPLANGRFGVRTMGTEGLDLSAGEFVSRAEAEAWILRRAMVEPAASRDSGLIKPGDGQDVD